MNIVIIPSHNQGKHIPKILQAYENQSIKPDLILFVLDRCVDNSLENLQNTDCKMKIEWIIKDFGENFSAGMTRDFGIDYIQKTYPEYRMIIFTDGDCIPSERLVELHLENINQSKNSIVSCGARNKQKENLEWEKDERLDERWINEFSFTDKNSRLIVANFLTLDNIFTYSCNFAFNKNAIELCQEINSKLSNSKRVFNPEFDGSWGGEDSFISHCLYRTGNYILMTNKECFVNHFYHPESPKQKGKKLLQDQLSRRLEKLILNGELSGPIQILNKFHFVSYGSFDYKNEIKNLVNVSGIDLVLSYYIENICEKYQLEKYRKIFEYFLTNNRTSNISGIRSDKLSDLDISYYKQMLGYMKFYLKDDRIIFEDDLNNFKKISTDTCFLDYVNN